MGATRFDTTRKLIRTAGKFFTISKEYTDDTKQLQFEFSPNASRFLYHDTGNYGQMTSRNYSQESNDFTAITNRAKVIFSGHKGLGSNITERMSGVDAGYVMNKDYTAFVNNHRTSPAIPVYSTMELNLWIQKGSVLVMISSNMLGVVSHAEMPRWIANNVNRAVNNLWLPAKYGYSSFIMEDETHISMHTVATTRNPMTIPKFGGRLVSL